MPPRRPRQSFRFPKDHGQVRLIPYDQSPGQPRLVTTMTRIMISRIYKAPRFNASDRHDTRVVQALRRPVSRGTLANGRARPFPHDKQLRITLPRHPDTIQGRSPWAPIPAFPESTSRPGHARSNSRRFAPACIVQRNRQQWRPRDECRPSPKALPS
jgi:hypothetical protein